MAHEAYNLNYPLLARPVAADHVILETAKKAEDDDAWIVRLYEYQQYRNNRVTLTFALPIREAVECNLMEEDDKPAQFEGNKLMFGITPFEVKTFKVKF